MTCGILKFKKRRELSCQPNTSLCGETLELVLILYGETNSLCVLPDHVIGKVSRSDVLLAKVSAINSCNYFMGGTAHKAPEMHPSRYVHTFNDPGQGQECIPYNN